MGCPNLALLLSSRCSDYCSNRFFYVGPFLCAVLGRGISSMDDQKMLLSSDKLLGGRIMFRQPKQGYRVAIDPVLVASAVPATNKSRVLDLGAGVGAASLCLIKRVPGCYVDAVELQKDLSDLAKENAKLNGVGGRLVVHTENILSLSSKFSQNFDHVMVNPPYLQAARAADKACQSVSTVEYDAKLPDWVSVAIGALRQKGSLTFIHRMDRLDELLSLIRADAGEIVVAPIWPHQGKEAKRVIVRARKGVSTPFRLVSGITLHRADGTFTTVADAILRKGTAFDLASNEESTGLGGSFSDDG